MSIKRDLSRTESEAIINCCEQLIAFANDGISETCTKLYAYDRVVKHSEPSSWGGSDTMSNVISALNSIRTEAAQSMERARHRIEELEGESN